MFKRERTIIITCIMILAMIVCLFSDAIIHPREAYGYTQKTGVIDVDTALNVRDGAGTSGTKILGTLAAGVTVVITGEKRASDNALWYQIKYSGGVGYISAKYVKDVKDKVDYTEDADFEAYLSQQGFPESYKPALRDLHANYPKWVFEADHLNYEWDVALKNQSKVGRSLITKNAISSWKSLETNSYDWNTGTWYTFDGGAWCAASKELVAYYMDPRNFLNETYIWMFEKLSYQMEFQSKENLEKILTGTFMEAGKNLIVNDNTGAKVNYADILMIAAERSGVSPFHLSASILVEMGNQGTSGSISGTYSGYEGYYNYYNWGAYAHSGRNPIQNGLLYAKGNDSDSLRPWNTRFKSLVGGAIKLGTSYINIGQDTLYYKKFDYIGTPYTHQYMTHIRAHEIEAGKTAKAYTTDVKEKTSIVFKIPVYKNMPEAAAVKPTGDGSPNNCLSTLVVNGQNLTPTFDKFTTEYTMLVDNKVSSIDINATAIIGTTKVTGTGTHELKEGSNTIKVTATAENGTARVYTITVVRQSAAPEGGNGSSGESIPPATTVPPEEMLVVNTSLKRDDNSKIISGIAIGSSISDLKSKVTVSGGTLEIQDSSGKAKNDGKVSTGDRVVIKDKKGTVKFSYSVIIYGDVNGDGNVSIKDLLVIRKNILGVTAIDGIYAEAGNVNRDNNGISIKDVLVLRKYILGVSGITQ